MKVYKFHAEWCAPCHTMTSIMKGMEYTVVDTESDEGMELARKYGIRGLPTIAVMDDNGEMLRSFTGVRPRRWIESWLNAS